MRPRDWFLVASAALAVLAPAVASARTADVEKVQVGVTGRNATEGFSPSLYVDVPVVADYRQLKFDGEQADWAGPDYTATAKPGSAMSDLSFRSDFENHVGSLDGMVAKGHVQTTWPQSEGGAVKVPRVLSGRVVGSVAGKTAVFEEPVTGAARYEAVVAIRLCHTVFGAVDFYADAPPEDSSGSAGQYLVGTTPAKQWNHDHAVAATQGVELDGPLPGGHVSARPAGRKVVGVVRDCGGGLRSIQLVLQVRATAGWTSSRRGVTGAGGKFALTAPKVGSYRVTAALGPFKASSGTVAVR
jgi:hypothetical protein